MRCPGSFELPFPSLELIRMERRAIIATAVRSFRFVWGAGPGILIAMTVISTLTGLLPTATVYLTSLLIDTIVEAAKNGFTPEAETRATIIVVLEAGLLICTSIIQKVNGHLSSLLNDQLSENVKSEILQKSIQLDYALFEDSHFSDELQRVSNDPTRPQAVVQNWLGLNQVFIGIASAVVLLWDYSPFAVLIVTVSAVPAFLMNIKLSKRHFKIHEKRTFDHRRQFYLQTVLTAPEYIKEVKCFGFGRYMLSDYNKRVREINKERRSLAVDSSVNATIGELISTFVLYFAYAAIAISAVKGEISVGQMTMYLQLFQRAQGSIASLFSSISSIYNDKLYIAPLYNFLDMEAHPSRGLTAGPVPGDGIRFHDVHFTYANSTEPAVRGVTFRIPPNQSVALVGENGAGKSTVVKLIMRLYRPTSGFITLDGLDLNDWDEAALRSRMSALFQDYQRYKLKIGQNIGIGDPEHVDNCDRWLEAASGGTAEDIIEALPQRYHTEMGVQFSGIELSGGQWQRIALARAYMKKSADIVILDEPASAIDAAGEIRLIDRFRTLMRGRLAIIISHRFSTVRLADRIIVLGNGKVIEDGTHTELIAENGEYATMYKSQAAAYA